MRRNEFPSKGICWLLAGALSGMSGCSVRKQQQAELRQINEVAELRTNDLYRAAKSEGAERAIRYWQQIQLSAPDSNGLQYPQSITQALSATQRTETRQDSAATQSVAHIATHSEKHVQQEATLRQSPFGWKWLTACVAVGGILLALYLYRRKS